MTVIGQLPTENISAITNYLNGFDICLLWLSGDPRLMARLENGGVTRFDIELAQQVSRHWPTVISRFKRLETLRVVRPSKFQRIWFREIDFASISPTLRHLELDFEYISLNLLALPIALPDLHPDPVWSPLTEGSLEVSPFRMERHFQNLETLILPRKIVASHLLIPMLPKTLLKLCLPYELISVKSLQQLPPYLTHLALPDLQEIPESEYPIFPSGLTHLELPSIYELSPESASQFSTSLTYLDLTQCQSDIVHLLPSGLVTVVLDFSPYVNESTFARLQSSLRHLHLRYETMITKPETLPPQLQSLSVRKLPIYEEDLRLLPRTLTALYIGTTSFDGPDCLNYLPASLRILSVEMDFIASSSPFPFLSSLEKLDARRVELSALQGATKLQSIRAMPLAYSEVDQWRCLHSLTELRSTDQHFLVNEEVMSHWPSTMTTLHFSTESQFSSLCLPRSLRTLHIVAPGIFADEFLANLPPHITDLELRGWIDRDLGLNNASSGPSCISDSGIPLLPRKIRRLLIRPAEKLTDAAIQHLPPHLTSLSLYAEHSPTLRLTNACAVHLPRKLGVLWLSPCPKINDEAAKHLPRTLWELNVVRRQPFTDKCTLDLPPLLLHLVDSRHAKKVHTQAEKFLIDAEKAYMSSSQ